jgi:catechol 2,3-dioxygenase-like lactoylglutathione lyase family enzyme
MTLGTSSIIAFVPTKDAARARRFYESTVGLRFVSADQFATVFDANGIMLRITPVQDFTPFPFTILGWQVADIEKTSKSLAGKGVSFERYKGMDHDALGIWTSPTTARVAWFKDPDGNLLSIAQV